MFKQFLWKMKDSKRTNTRNSSVRKWKEIREVREKMKRNERKQKNEKMESQARKKNERRRIEVMRRQVE